MKLSKFKLTKSLSLDLILVWKTSPLLSNPVFLHNNNTRCSVEQVCGTPSCLTNGVPEHAFSGVQLREGTTVKNGALRSVGAPESLDAPEREIMGLGLKLR